MPVKLKDTMKAKKLFGDWQDALEYFTDVREEIQDKKSAKAYLEAYFSGKYSK